MVGSPTPSLNFSTLARRTKRHGFFSLEKSLAHATHTLERLDFSNDPAQSDRAGYQAERRALQLAYSEKRRKDGHLYYDAIDDTDLDHKVERLRDELAELQRAFKNSGENKVLRAFAVGFVLLALIGGSVWWFGYEQHRGIQQISEEARHITKEKIRDR